VALTVLYFAAARQAAGTDRETVEAAPATVAELRRLLVGRHPKLEPVLARCRIALDQELAVDADPVPPDAEVAVIPPVSGGAPLFRVVDRPLDLVEVVAAVAGPGRGGVVTFTGTVRGESRGKRVVRLEYEAYRPMAERTLAEIGRAVEAEHGAVVAVVHRVGARAGRGGGGVAPRAPPCLRACEWSSSASRDAPIQREVYQAGLEWVGLGP
jgi:molybdopterin synthase catalytic subunit